MKAAVIGLGRIGFEFGLEKGREQPASHFHCYLENPLVDGIFLADIDPAKIPDEAVLANYTMGYQAKNRNVHIVTYHLKTGILDEMLEDSQPDVVSICTPTPTHKEIACKVAEYPSVKAIFLEKPIAQSLSEADAIINACWKAEIKLTVDHVRRWDPVYLKLMAELTERPYTIIGTHPGPLIRTGIHMLDLFNWIASAEPLTIQSFGVARTNYITHQPPRELDGWVDYNVNGCITYPQTEAVFYSGKSVEKLTLFELDVLTENTRIRITENGDRMETFHAHASHRYDGLKEYYSKETYHRAVDQCVQTSPLLDAVKEVCSSNMNSCSGETARSALNVALALHWSAMHKGTVVKLKEVPKDFKVESY